MILSDEFIPTPRAAMKIPFFNGAGGMAGMGDYSPPDDTASTITSTIRDAVTAWNQQQILQANIDRARQGLPPINTASIAPTYNVGLSPETRNVLLLAAAALAFVLLMKRSR